MPRAPDLSVDVFQSGRTTVVTVAGELDLASVGLVEQALPEIRPGARLVLDLRPLTFMDSTGLRLLMQLDLRARAEQWKFAIARTGGAVADLLRLTRMEDRVSVVADPGEID